MITCTNNQNFEEGENCASTISVEQTLGSNMNFIGFDMILFGSDLILLGSIFHVHELLVLLVVVLINFGVKKQVPQVSFKTATRDLISFHSFGSAVNLFRSDLHSDLILFVHILKSKSFQSCL